jgi:hypothetical protein
MRTGGQTDSQTDGNDKANSHSNSANVPNCTSHGLVKVTVHEYNLI